MRYFFALIMVACATPAVLTRAPGTDEPCGPRGVVCSGKMCCDEGEVCGGEAPFNGCPSGMCCYVGTEARAEKKNHAQRSAK